MRTIVRIKFGSHLYGTSTPTSDLDYKAVYVPTARDILLQRVKGSVSNRRDKAEGEKNAAGEVDEEAYSLQRYLELLAEGQTVAVDVLFAPPASFAQAATPEWCQLVNNRHKLVTRKSAAFIGYCRQQANKYGIKGSRVAAARKALEILESLCMVYPHSQKLGLWAPQIEPIAQGTEHMDTPDIPVSGGARIVRHWEVCNRKLPYTSSIGFARDVMKKLVDEYGSRALQAESNNGADWKALSHAVRVGREAIELLKTGHITFPLPYADHVLKIKKGELPYQVVAEEIEQLLSLVEIEAENSKLPDAPDQAWIDDFVAEVHRHQVAMHDATR